MILLNNIKKRDKIIAYALVALVLCPGFNYYACNILVDKMGLPSVSTILYGLMMYLSIYGCYVAKKGKMIGKRMPVICSLFVIMTIMSYLLYGDRIGIVMFADGLNPIHSEAIYLWIFCLPAFILSNSCQNWDAVLKVLGFFSPVVIGVGFYAYYLNGFLTTYGGGVMDYMSLSYFVLTAGCTCFYYFFNYRSLIHLPFALIASFIILTSGCRGALVCIAVFLVIQIYHQIRVNPKSKHTKVLKAWLVGLALYIILSATLNFDIVANWQEGLGISSRFVTMMTEASFFEDNARNTISKAIWQGIEENPFGYGLFGDRYLCSKYYVGGVEYAHNFIMEVWASFGFFLGTIIILVIYTRIAKHFFMKVNNSYTNILVILIPIGILSLLFSGTFLTRIEFFIIIGMLFSNKSSIFISKIENENIASRI